MIEETGVTPEIGKLLFIQQYRDEKREFLEFFFHITNADAYETIDLASTTHGSLELARCEFIDPRKEYILPEFLQTTDITKAIDSDQPTHVASYL